MAKQTDQRDTIVKVDILDQGIQRFAISGLSKERRKEAVDEEMILDKSTGEFLIKNKKGVVISFDSLSRGRSSLDQAIYMAEQSGICGDLYQIEIDDITLPSNIPQNLNILNESFVLPNESSKFLLNLDVNEYIAVDGDTKPLEIESNVAVTFSKGDLEMTITKKISEINKFVVDTDKFSSEKMPVSVSKIEFIPHKDYLGDEDVVLVLHNIFITVNKEVE